MCRCCERTLDPEGHCNRLCMQPPLRVLMDWTMCEGRISRMTRRRWALMFMDIVPTAKDLGRR